MSANDTYEIKTVLVCTADKCVYRDDRPGTIAFCPFPRCPKQKRQQVTVVKKKGVTETALKSVETG